MKLTEKVICPYNGIIKNVFVRKKDFVVEKDILFEIQVERNNELKQIYSGIEGIISSLNIGKGEEVSSGNVLASIKQDL